MDFLGIGPFEILLILIVAFLALGPGRMKEVSRTLGKGLREARKAWTGLERELTEEVGEAKPEKSESKK